MTGKTLASDSRSLSMELRAGQDATDAYREAGFTAPTMRYWSPGLALWTEGQSRTHRGAARSRKVRAKL